MDSGSDAQPAPPTPHSRTRYAIIAIIIVLAAIAVIEATNILNHGSRSTPTALTTITAPTNSTGHYTHSFLSTLLSVSNPNPAFGMIYNITISSNTTSTPPMSITMEKYYNYSRVQINLLASQHSSQFSSFLILKNGSNYVACIKNQTISQCFRIPANATVNATSASFAKVLASLNFTSVSSSAASFNGKPCTLESAIFIPPYSGGNGNITISACMSKSTGIIYNFTLFPTHVTPSTSIATGPGVSIRLASLFAPTLANITALPNSTVSQKPPISYYNGNGLQGIEPYIYAVNNLNPVIFVAAFITTSPRVAALQT